MTHKEFEQLVASGIEKLPEWVRREMRNVAFVIEEEPSEEQAGEEGGVLFGLYEGVPLTERGEEEPLYPDKITIFKRAILGTYKNPEDIRACVENTIWHEVAHHFGHDEEWLEQEERKRGKLL